MGGKPFVTLFLWTDLGPENGPIYRTRLCCKSIVVGEFLSVLEYHNIGNGKTKISFPKEVQCNGVFPQQP